MIHDEFLDRNGTELHIGDVVWIIDRGFPDVLGMVTCFFQKWTDPVQVKYGGVITQRESEQLELATQEQALLWKLENL